MLQQKDWTVVDIRQFRCSLSFNITCRMNEWMNWCCSALIQYNEPNSHWKRWQERIRIAAWSLGLFHGRNKSSDQNLISIYWMKNGNGPNWSGLKMATSTLSKTVEMPASNQKHSFLKMSQPILHQNCLDQVSKWILVCHRHCEEDYWSVTENPTSGEDTHSSLLSWRQTAAPHFDF